MRTIAVTPPISAERMKCGRPVLMAKPDNAWESRVVLNPAAVMIEAGPELELLFQTWDLSENQRNRVRLGGGACVMLYRAQGNMQAEKAHAPSYLGLAVFTLSLDLVMRWPDPVIQPTESFHDLGVEDPRCTLVGDTYFLYYTGYASGVGGADNTTRICLATTTNFVDWDLLGPVEGDLNDVPNKNPALFPEMVGGKWLMLHRPMAGSDAMTVHLAEAASPAGPWVSRGRFMHSFAYREFAKSWIGAGGPPLALGEDRFLMVYHQGHFTEEGKREYDLAVALLDFKEIDPVVSRIEPFMRPSRKLEQEGDPDWGVNNVLFTCANYRLGDSLIIPYAGADSRIFGARVPFEPLVAALERGIVEVEE